MNVDLNERLNKLRTVISGNLTAGRVFNIVLNHIDPDSIGCGFGMRHLLRHFGVPNARMRILYVGDPGGEQNRMIIDRYNLTTHMLPLAKFWPSGDGEVYDNSNDVYLLVDSSSPDDGRLGVVSGKIRPIVVVDHHKNQAPEETDTSFIWIEQVGACSTMIIGLLIQANLIGFTKESGDDVFTPVLLALGIRSDTHGLTANITGDDLSAYAEIYNKSNQADLRALIQIPKPKAQVAAEDYARAHRIHNGLRLVACAGYIGRNSVYVAELANEMVSWQGVSVAVVFGLTDDCKIVFSIRSTDITLHSSLNQKLQQEFNHGCGVKRSEDGSLLEGGGQISLGMNLASDWDNREAFLQVVMKHMQNIFLSDVIS